MKIYLLFVVFTFIPGALMGHDCPEYSLQVYPTFSGSVFLPETNEIKYSFGYINLEDDIIGISPGGANTFSPAPSFRNQPGIFEPGETQNAFSTVTSATAEAPRWTLLACLVDPPKPEGIPFAGGNGSESNPYQIETLENLQAVQYGPNQHYLLVNDIDAADTADWNDGDGFIPIGTSGTPFNGSLDGNGYTITGLTINRSSENDIGIFGVTGEDSEIRNLALEEVEIKGDTRVGGFAGTHNGTIREVYVTGNVTGSSFTGGLIGSNNGEISNTYSLADVSGDFSGGLAGVVNSGGTIQTSYSGGAVSGNSFTGGLIGLNTGTVTDSYWNTETSNQTDSGGGTGLVISQTIDLEMFDGFDFEDTWKMYDGFSFPFLQNAGERISGVLEISGKEGWRMMSSPSGEVPYGEVFSELWLQGFPGTDYEEGSSNLFGWDEGSREFVMPSHANDSTVAGSGFVFYIFEDDVHGEPGEFPKQLFYNSSVSPDVVQVPVSATDENENSMIDGMEGWNLPANPFAFPISVDALLDAAESVDEQVNLNVYVWDHSAGAEGEYVTLVYGEDETIAPFQAFFMRFGTPGLDAELVLDPEVLQTDEAVFFKKEGEEKTPAELTIHVEGEGLQHAWQAVFDDDTDPRKNAYYLSPLSENRLNLTSHIDSAQYVRQFYTVDTGEELEIPLTLETTKSGTFTITTNTRGFEDWKFSITDLQTGSTTYPDQDGEYDFTAQEGTSERFVLSVITADQPVSADEDLASTLPEKFGLEQNYPNPFNPNTVINYQLPVNSEVRLEVFDVLGRRVATLVNGLVSAGYHTAGFDASFLASGVYVYRIEAGDFVESRQMLLVK